MTAATDVTSLTAALVSAPSPNPPGDERAVVAALDRHLEGLPGVDCSILGPRAERPSLVAVAGDGPKTLTLAAHLDTHPVAAGWTRDPFKPGLECGRLYGLGTTDNKGAAAAMAVAFRSAVERGLPPGTRLVLVANADEERGGAEGIGFLRDAVPFGLGAVVVAEPSGINEPWERLWLAARGTSRFQLQARGDETHASLAGSPGVESAVERLLSAIPKLERSLSEVLAGDATLGEAGRLTVVEIRGGVGWGVVPPRASAEVELRLMPGWKRDEIEARVVRAAAANGLDVEFASGGLAWMGSSRIAREHQLCVAAEAAWGQTFGSPPALGCFPGGTDARLFEERSLPVLSGVGPGALIRAHHADEWVGVTELHQAVDLYLAIIDRYLGPEGGTAR